ncbi:MAG: histone deacetylase [Acidobacteria bacterium]|nr:histone deacetylase [Acidobacteriota bacterium]
MQFGIVLDSIFTRHFTPEGHPERPERIEAILEAIEKWDQSRQLVRIVPNPVKEEWILAVHTSEHFEGIQRTAGKSVDQLDPDTYTSPDSFQTAILAAGSVVTLLDQLLEKNIDSGFALIRPPGHHAESNRAMGFCLFNNVAVATEWAIRNGGLEKVAIVDFDAHHGNGTQEIFYSRSDVLYLSTHQYPFYPGTGHFTEMGESQGEGFTVNFPLRAGGGNHFYCALFSDFVLPIIRQFHPNLILVSAGYDAHRSDPLAGMNLEVEGFGQLFNLLNSVAREICEGRILYVLEGGYSLKALSEAVVCSIATTVNPQNFPIQEEQAEEYVAYREQARQVFSRYWEVGGRGDN